MTKLPSSLVPRDLDTPSGPDEYGLRTVYPDDDPNFVRLRAVERAITDPLFEIASAILRLTYGDMVRMSTALGEEIENVDFAPVLWKWAHEYVGRDREPEQGEG